MLIVSRGTQARIVTRPRVQRLFARWFSVGAEN